MNPSAVILTSWEANAENWIASIDKEEIETRKLATNAAIVETVCQFHNGTIIDMGCGEGWLTRVLQEKGFEAHGIDGVEALIVNARNKSNAKYLLGTYDDITTKNVRFPFIYDSAVINFALIDKAETENLIQFIPTLIKKKGFLFIQTLHPLSIAIADNYVSGWKEGSWAGMKQNFVQPYKWYFRTLQDWCLLFTNAGFSIIDLKEPIHPETHKPVSIIFVLQAH